MNCWILVLLLFCCGNNRSGDGSCTCGESGRNRRSGGDSCGAVSESACRRERSDDRERDCDRDRDRERDRDWDRERERRGEQECDCQRANSHAEPRLEPRQFISYQTNRDCGCE